MKITKEVLNKGKSSRNGWNHKQLGLLGVGIPLVSGWYKRLIGSDAEIETVKQFWALKDAHLKGKVEKCPYCGQAIKR